MRPAAALSEPRSDFVWLSVLVPCFLFYRSHGWVRGSARSVAGQWKRGRVDWLYGDRRREPDRLSRRPAERERTYRVVSDGALPAGRRRGGEGGRLRSNGRGRADVEAVLGSQRVKLGPPLSRFGHDSRCHGEPCPPLNRR